MCGGVPPEEDFMCGLTNHKDEFSGTVRGVVTWFKQEGRTGDW